MSFLKENKKYYCTGCNACVEVCPLKIIHLEMDEEGFFYPVIDKTKCVHCNLCVSTCDNRLKSIFRNEPKCFWGIGDDKLLVASSSGGAFYAISKAFCQNNDFEIYGCTLDNKLKARHICINSFDDFHLLQKSKYLQSNNHGTYSSVLSSLKNNKKVVYSGTPCQIAGLNSFMSCKGEFPNDNLLTIDIVCHGCPSQLLFDRYLNEIKEKTKYDIIDVQFKTKKYRKLAGQWYSKNITITNTKRKMVLDIFQSSYLRGFQATLFFRPSCYKCIFANTNRVGDITIGDFWKIENFDSSLDVNHGVSLIQINNQQKDFLISKLSDYITISPVPYQFVLDTSNGFSCKSHDNVHPQREVFYSAVINGKTIDEAVDQCLGKISIGTKVTRIISFVIPKKIKRMIRKA